MTELIPIKQIKQSSQLQPRAKMDTGKIDEYTESMKKGDAFPAILVYRVGGDLFLVDGYHRFMAAQGAKLDKILAEVRAGTMRDAILQSVGANSKHGLNRSNDDKERAVLILINDKEWREWNNTKIAEVCHVTPEFVGKIRKDNSPALASATPEKKKVVRAGKTIRMDTSKIGKGQKKERPATPFPEHVPPAPCTVPLKSDPAKPPQPSLAQQVRAKEMTEAGANQGTATGAPLPDGLPVNVISAPDLPFTPAFCAKGCPDGLQHLQRGSKEAGLGDKCDLTGSFVRDHKFCPYLERQRRAAAGGFVPASAIDRLDAAKPLIERPPVKIVKTQMTDQERTAWADAGIEHGGFFTKKEQEQIDELVAARYEGIKSRADFFWRAACWFLASAEGGE